MGSGLIFCDILILYILALVHNSQSIITFSIKYDNKIFILSLNNHADTNIFKLSARNYLSEVGKIESHI